MGFIAGILATVVTVIILMLVTCTKGVAAFEAFKVKQPDNANSLKQSFSCFESFIKSKQKK